jgi:lipopolysaccharide biosynthesis glycosyltransferase
LFHVFTDDVTGLPQKPDWVIHHLPKWGLPQIKAWWYKLEIFNPARALPKGRNLYLDLDVIVTGDLRDMWTFAAHDFVICRDFNRTFIRDFNQCNSSVMVWSDDSLSWVYEDFLKNKDIIMRKHRGDQDYINEKITQRSWLPDEWALSYRWEVWRGGHKDGKTSQYHLEEPVSVIPEDCKMIVFHGQPKPHEITERKLIDLWSKP